jgi:hypothetical protein
MAGDVEGLSRRAGLSLRLVAVILGYDLFRKPVSTHRVNPESMLFGIML